jgi:hypothetical protein
MHLSKPILKALIFAAALVTATSASAADNPFKPKAPFKSAIVQYQYQGSEKGHSTVYYQGQTMAEHKETKTTLWGMDQGQQNTIAITKPREIIRVDLRKRTASASGNQMAYMAQEYEKLSAEEKARVRKNAEKMGRSMLTLFQGGQAQIQEGSLMGKPVNIVSVLGLTSYVWKDKGVLLKQEGSLMGMKLDTVATKIEEAAPVPDGKMRVPDGIKVVFDQQADQKQRQMAKQMMDLLKDPQFGQKSGAMAMQPAGGQQAGAAQETEPSAQAQGKDPVKEGMNLLKKTLGF